MTNREFYTAITTAAVSDELKEFALNEIAKLDARNDKRRNTLSKEQKANEELKAAILEAIGIGSMTAADIAKACNLSSTQKASALCGLLVKDGKLVANDLKVKGKGTVKAYSVVITE